MSSFAFFLTLVLSCVPLLIGYGAFWALQKVQATRRERACVEKERALSMKRDPRFIFRDLRETPRGDLCRRCSSDADLHATQIGWMCRGCIQGE